jgi:hypothetical protein
LVSSATHDRGAELGGHISPWQMDLYHALAGVGVGLIVSGIFYETAMQRISPRQNTLDHSRFIPRLTRLAVPPILEGRKLRHWQNQLGRQSLGPCTLANGEDRRST